MAIRNIEHAVQEGLENQALGMLICDWSGKGHVTDTLFAIPPLIVAAGMSWNSRVDVVSGLGGLVKGILQGK